MQMAHVMNQLFELSSLLAEGRETKESLAHIWLCLVGALRHDVLDFTLLAILLAFVVYVRIGIGRMIDAKSRIVSSQSYGCILPVRGDT